MTLRHPRSLLALLLLLPTLGFATEFAGLVVGITDGDTIKVLVDQNKLKIRLYGIDSPECGQAFGKRAKQLAGQLAFNRDVRVEQHDVDRRGRIVGDVYLPDGRLLNEEMVRGGLAWWFRKYAPGNTTLEKLEVEARSDKTWTMG